MNISDVEMAFGRSIPNSTDSNRGKVNWGLVLIIAGAGSAFIYFVYQYHKMKREEKKGKQHHQ